MISIIDKVNTLRIATATSTLRSSKEAIECLKTNNVPKKDILIVARIAGVAAAKKTGDIIPYCHPLTLDSVAIDFDVQTDHIVVTATIQTIWRTGVEMEALCAASVAALTIYDMLKPIDKDMEITATKLLSKKGGKTSYKEWTPEGFTAAVIVTSDGTAKGTREDKSGKLIEARLKEQGITPSYIVLPDNYDEIVEKLNELCAKGVNLIMTTGGTGLGPRDITVEATEAVMDREVPGIMEAARSYGQSRTPYAMLSRGLAAQKGQTLIINLPGSSKGVSESLNAIFPSLLHAYSMMQGGGH